MKRHEFELKTWCEKAVCEIRYKPDRKKVFAELYGHAMDRYDHFASEGMDDDEALKATLEAMGKPTDVSYNLAKVHNPFWGYVIQVSQIALIALLVLSLLPIWKYVKQISFDDPPNYAAFDVFDPASYDKENGPVLHHLSKPGASFRSEAGVFTVTDAALYTTFPSENTYSGTRLYLQIRQQSLLPNREHGEYFESFGICSYFTARDSLGNEYPNFWDPNLKDTPSINASSRCYGVFTQIHSFWINDFPEDAKWVEIIYNRDGRDYSLRIDLTGGDHT